MQETWTIIAFSSCAPRLARLSLFETSQVDRLQVAGTLCSVSTALLRRTAALKSTTPAAQHAAAAETRNPNPLLVRHREVGNPLAGAYSTTLSTLSTSQSPTKTDLGLKQ